MGYTNSKLTAYTKLSPNHSGQRTHAIDRITPHCVVGQCTAEGLGDWFAQSSTSASSNYGIDKDGRVGLYVEEKNRSWCSSSNANDQRAVTIECASDTTEPYAFRDVVYQKLIALCADICQRNGKKKLLWLGDKDTILNYIPKSDEMVLTAHRFFANKSCPGNWMYARMGDLAEKVTALLGGITVAAETTETTVYIEAVEFDTMLSKGDEGSAVEKMQTMLIACGYTCGECGADGCFGNDTLQAVMTFQMAASLEVDGIYGPETEAALKAVYATKTNTSTAVLVSAKATGTGMQATELKNLSEADVIARVGPLCTADQKKTGVLASVTLAQFILESGYGKTELAQGANNCFGMKKSLSGNTWSGSTWDGTSAYRKKTGEQNSDGSYVTITADFRKYPCVEDSIADHSAYLLGAKNGSAYRYAGLKGCTDYEQAAKIIRGGGYATDLSYVSKLCSIIQRWGLTKYEAKDGDTTQEITAEKTETPVVSVTATQAKYINSTGTHYISNSGSDENGRGRGGQAGDQTGKEWQLRTWYDRPWDVVLRYPDQRVALKIAQLGIDAALNNCIGYDMNQRDTYFTQLKKAGWEPSKITAACEADCSAGVCANVKAAGYLLGIAALQNHAGTYTGNMRSALTRAGFQVLTASKYLNGSEYLLPGDILLNDVHHTATNITVGAKVKKFWNPGTAVTTEDAIIGSTEPTATKFYRVRKSWADKDSQIGAFTVFQNAINAVDANPGYAAFDDAGNQVYPSASFKPYLVKVSISDLNYRKGPSASYGSWGHIKPGIYTIVDEQDGWGLLKAYAGERNGWISLNYAKKI